MVVFTTCSGALAQRIFDAGPGTGGGERLLELREARPARVTETEEHPPNIQLATERLAPLGVRVAAVRLTEVDPLPFDDAEFDVVLNRHSAFNCAEVARVMAPGGTFFTQQVHGRSFEELQAGSDAVDPPLRADCPSPKKRLCNEMRHTQLVK